jgi:hypothetical protein
MNQILTPYFTSAEDVSLSQKRVLLDMLPEEYFLREELMEKGLAWASEEESKVKTHLSMDEFKALMRIELRRCGSCLNIAFVLSICAF